MELFETKVLLALFVPALLVILFTRVTFNYGVGFLLTVALITASVYAGYTQTWLLYAMDAFSLTVGLAYAKHMVEKSRT